MKHKATRHAEEVIKERESSSSWIERASAGNHTVYGWIKTETGMISASFSAVITFTLPTVASGATPVVQEGLTVNANSTLTAGLTINSGATATTSRTVSLTLSGLGTANITHYEASESSTPSSYTAVSSPSTTLQSTISYQLSTTDGSKTVYLHLKDSVNTTATASATITLDGTAPTGALKLDSGAKLTVDSTVSANITGTDAIGVTGYFISDSSTTPAATASGWTAVTSTTALSTSINRTLTDLTGLSTQYLWLKDAAGNVSATISDGIEVVRITSLKANGFNSSITYGQYASIVTDSSNHAHISFYRVTGGNLLWVEFDPSSQDIISDSTIDGAGFGNADVGASTSIAIDSNNALHVAYRDSTNSTLKYATNASGSWVTETVEAGGTSPSIGIDSNNKVHIAHQSGTNVRYVNNLSGSWSSEAIITNATSTDDVGPSSIFVDSSNAVHVARNIGFGSRVRYASNSSGSWQVETIATGTLGSGPSVIVDEGTVYAAFPLDSTIQLDKESPLGIGRCYIKAAKLATQRGLQWISPAPFILYFTTQLMMI